MIRATCTITVLAAVLTFSHVRNVAYCAGIPAFTEPYRSIDVAASEMGTLSELNVSEGDRVRAGQVMGKLDDDVLQASLKMSEAAMNARGRLESAQAEYDMQRQRLEKLIGLRERNHASEHEVERAQSQLEVATANLTATHEDLRIKAIEFERIQAQLVRRQIVSPIDGYVTELKKDIGEFVTTAEPVVATVVQLNPLKVTFSAPVAAAQSLSASDNVVLFIGPEERQAIGTIEFVSPIADAQSGTVRVKVRLPNPDGQYSSGVSCQVDLSANVPSSSNKEMAAKEIEEIVPSSDSPVDTNVNVDRRQLAEQSDHTTEKLDTKTPGRWFWQGKE
ncbi:MAG: efflux RND transporter periplasmic adaptor subunit [Planctomycetales bacterium]|nr:efflux RND transporter periplasmic adaptor subunit [Planctomycetales bacterium]